VVDESPGRRAIRLAVSAVGVVDEGVRLGTLVTMSDVTDEEHARQRLLQSEKLSVVGQTLASVAHELNNPLAAIVGYADLLHDSDVAPEVAKILGRIREQATRTSRIVKNLLSVARRRGPERSRVDLNEVAHSVIDLFAYEARLSNITIHVDLDAALPVVYADRHALQQLLVNLVQNAIHALRSAERPDPARPRSISVRTRAQSDGAALSVADDGPGVPVENRERVFEPFFTTKGSDQGTGLGLAIARGIAREHGGDLVLESRSDGLSGAVFTLRLPFAEGAAAREPAASPIPDGVPAHVLLVDDEAPVRDSLSAQLVRMGAHVDSAGTPLEASRLLESSAPYDVVLMDLRLPGQSGLDLHRTLAARNPDLARRVVFMTGDLVNDDLLKAVRATGNLLLEKPFTADELREALAKAQPRA
jgi:two-component system NtrC family sensor kinase